ncbi:MAG: GNAT family N-acetyltransferase [Ignavibacteriaceae bacterium]|nr:GNAT family N-acetyltransferase [Ignavibacteriaceae bacterium]
MIRTATEQDLDSVLKIERLSFGIPWNLRSFRKALQEIFLVENEVAGYLIAKCCQRSCHIATIERLAVHPEQRRTGIGKALIDMGLTILMDRGVELVMLNVEFSRRAAIRLYTKFGFRITYSSFCHASILFSMDTRAYTFYTMELQMNKRNTFTPHSPLNENPKHNLNGILPPFEIGGRDGATWDEMMWW